MKKNIKIIIPIAIVGIAGISWLAFGFFGIQALFADKKIDEDIPDTVSKLIESGGSNGLIGKGEFEQGDSTYTIKGSVFLSEVDGKVNLTLKDFDVTNGPNLFIYAVKTKSTDNQTVKQTVADGGFVNLGVLKGNIGSQNYVLDEKIDLEEYQVISIWCQRFSRNFGSAVIQ